MVTIDEEDAEALLHLCQSVSLPSAQAKLLIGKAQAALEAGLRDDPEKANEPKKVKLPFGLERLVPHPLKKLLPGRRSNV